MDLNAISHIKCALLDSRFCDLFGFGFGFVTSKYHFVILPLVLHFVANGGISSTFERVYFLMLSDPDFRELVTLPLPTSVLREFSRVGYSNVGEISGLTVEQIESVCKISKPRAASIATAIQDYVGLRKDGLFSTTNFPNKNLFYPRSALQMLHPSTSNLVNPKGSCVTNILTMSKSFDDLMGGGFPCGRITELCGQPGVGKTQFCLQTTLTVQIPQWCGGLDGEAVFLDTEGSFIPKRLHQMAVELVNHCQTMIAPCLRHYIDGLGNAKSIMMVFFKSVIHFESHALHIRKDVFFLRGESYADAEEKAACLEALSRIPTEESLLSKVHYIRCTGYLQLLAAVQRLGEFCKYHPNIRLIIVDSIAFPFRYEFEDIPQRNRLLAAVAQSLLSTASSQNAAVIMTNQITTKFVTDATSTTTHSTLVPALGDSWGHICSVRLLLSKTEDSGAEQRRTARLLKHPGRPPGTAAYQVTAGGIRDCF
ncbi:hypothetical protein TSMEX_004353 [Taenia solium]|eukprot:TsM_000160700 transcript=TsM_000160700 gene=TsM_000160700